MNTQSDAKAVQIAKTYVEAITNQNVESIMSVSADDVVCTSPIGRIAGAPRKPDSVSFTLSTQLGSCLWVNVRR